MKPKDIIILLTMVAVVTVAATLVVLKYQTAVPATQPAPKIEDRAQSEPVNNQVTTQVEPPVLEPLPPLKGAGPSNVKTQAVAVTPQSSRDPRLNDPVFKEQLGRYALNFVGADPDADAVWAALIYDPSLSETVREDLMEDLNENGFSGGDGSRPTVDDLPVIENRIALLEEHMLDADEFMLTHLAEAYKDLVTIYVRLSQ